MKINLYMEGGVGDHILAHRFSVKIKEKYPNSNLHVFSDTENNFLMRDVLSYLYKDFYSSITVIPNKKYKKCIIDSQFGQEEYRGGLHNVPDEIKNEMMNNCDKFYSLHLDSLEFLNYKDIEWWNDFNVIPKPNINPENKWGRHLVFHLLSGSSQTHKMEDWYIKRLILDAAQLLKEYDIYIIATEEQLKQYHEILNFPTYPLNIKVFSGSIYEICDLILTSSGGIYIDSAFRLLSRAQNLPTIDLSKDCRGYSGVPYSHRCRWLLWPNSTFELHYNTNEILKMFKGMLENPLFRLMPELSLTNQELSSILISRKFEINTEKSILN